MCDFTWQDPGIQDDFSIPIIMSRQSFLPDGPSNGYTDTRTHTCTHTNTHPHTHAQHSAISLDIQHLHGTEDHLSAANMSLNFAEDTGASEERQADQTAAWLPQTPAAAPQLQKKRWRRRKKLSAVGAAVVCKWMGTAGTHADIYTTHIDSSQTSGVSFEREIFSYFMTAWGDFWLNTTEKWTLCPVVNLFKVCRRSFASCVPLSSFDCSFYSFHHHLTFMYVLAFSNFLVHQ